eukprot:TRINITY_DN7222_c0_g1_i1.p1 TRINITY_DN7222_c0_g1~~TRINITY_DN7222_c0_g1_i1.p1  ORF type:complete len:938 (-),score=158.31 TRINITY_DN7222_c0_g1_i1:203-3016(-)
MRPMPAEWSVPTPPHTIEDPHDDAAATVVCPPLDEQTHPEPMKAAPPALVVTESISKSNSRIQQSNSQTRIRRASFTQGHSSSTLRPAPIHEEVPDPKVHPMLHPRVRSQVKAFTASVAFKATGGVALCIALFGSGLFILFDVPDSWGTGLQDVLMVAVTIYFMVEIVTLSLAGDNYWMSFFFFMDILGTISMVFEISFILGNAGKTNLSKEEVNPLLLRSARAAKIGARSAQLTKLFKCSSYMNRHDAGSATDPKNGRRVHDAKVLKKRLSLTLSTKVSMLTVVLIIGVPLFSLARYPQADLSMDSFIKRLELDYLRSKDMLAANPNQNGANFFRVSVEDMKKFYDGYLYSPYELVGYPEKIAVDGKTISIPGASLVHDRGPRRNENINELFAPKCLVKRAGCEGDVQASVRFDFTKQNQMDAVWDISLVLFVILCMILESFDLNRTLDVMLVRPVETMLGTVTMMAKILSTVTSFAEITKESSVGSIDIEAGMSESQLLEQVFMKLAKLTKDFLQQGRGVDQFDTLDDESKGVVFEIMQIGGGSGDEQLVAFREVSERISPVQGNVVENLPVDRSVIESWDLDIVNLSSDAQFKVMQFIFFDSKIGKIVGRFWSSLGTFHRFHELVKGGYLDIPYHNYFHSCDVVASVFRMFLQMRCDEWLSDIDMFALLVSAMCHDIGHPGKTTPFLVETMHELAVRYNDRSPLENMHCATLFELCKNQSADAFARFDKSTFKQARKVCVASILHTDNALHFEMVKEVSKAYDVTSDICDAQAKDPNVFSQAYIDEVLFKDQSMWHKLILHLADISNPLKPFTLARAWAARVQDEFFAQGDEEKQLGIPVGMLNDREKMTRSGTEHGFIVFLVAPLAVAAVGAFPALLPLATQMVVVLQEWRTLWVQQTDPTPEDIKKREADIQRIHEQVESSRQRNPVASIRT